MDPIELSKFDAGKSPATIATALDVENGGIVVSRHQRHVETRESQKKADEAMLAKFGKKQQLTVSTLLSE